jgi:hypothetical protein
MAQASAMLMPSIREASAARLSRVPPHSGHGVKVTARSTNARMCGWSASLSFCRKDFCTFGTRGGQPFQQVDVGAGQARHEALHKGAVGLVDQPLGLGGDGAEDQRALARPGDAGEHRQPALGDVEGDVGQVVLPGPADLDPVVAVGEGSFGLLAGHVVTLLRWSAQAAA